MWGHSRPAFAQADAYRKQAEAIKERARKEMAKGVTKDTLRATNIRAMMNRSAIDEAKVAERIEELRLARERNHFTDRIRALLDGQRNS